MALVATLVLAGCSASEGQGGSPSVEADPGPSVSPSIEPSLTSEAQAAQAAEAAYVAWMGYRDATLQNPPPIRGEGADAALEVFLAETRQHGFDEVESDLVSTVDQYLERGWRQVGGLRLTQVRTVSVDLQPREGRPTASVHACVVPDGLSIVDADGELPPEFEGVETRNLVLEARVEMVQEGSFDGWYMRTLGSVEGESC